MLSIELKNPETTTELGRHIAHKLINNPTLIFLCGDLGAGKTSFARGFISEASKELLVLSPTYAYMHSYKGSTPIHHFDLYRIDTRTKLDELGIADFIHDENAHRLIEWPQSVEHMIKPHLIIELKYFESHRKAILSGNNKLLALLDIPHNEC